jgi:hypothetical protein
VIFEKRTKCEGQVLQVLGKAVPGMTKGVACARRRPEEENMEL